MVDLSTPEWPSVGSLPSDLTRISYSSGEQPVSSWDNAFNYRVSQDLRALNQAVEDHAADHESGGGQEIDIGGLEISENASLGLTNGNHALYSPTDVPVYEIDTVNETILSWPAFRTPVDFERRVAVEADIQRSSGETLYSYADNIFHRAAQANRASEAGQADNSLQLGGYQPQAYPRKAENATIDGSWEFTELLDASISGNAVTADFADTADQANHADSADYATNAGHLYNQDQTQRYTADDFLDSDTNVSGGLWTLIETRTDQHTGNDLEFDIHLDEIYDRYMISLFTENQDDDVNWVRFNLNDDHRERYYATYVDQFHGDLDIGQSRGASCWFIGENGPYEFGMQTLFVSCPRPIAGSDRSHPKLSNGNQGTVYDHGSHTIWGELKSNYRDINGMKFDSPRDMTGAVEIYGRQVH